MSDTQESSYISVFQNKVMIFRADLIIANYKNIFQKDINEDLNIQILQDKLTSKPMRQC